MAYRIIVKDKSGNKLGEFEKFIDLTFNKRRNNYGSCTFKVPANDAKLNTLYAPRVYECYIYSHNILVWAGEQASRIASLKADKNNWVEITCYQFLEMFNHRFTVAERIFDIYDNLDAGEIARILIQESQLQFTDSDYQNNDSSPVYGQSDLTRLGGISWNNDYGLWFVDLGGFGGAEVKTNYLRTTFYGSSIPNNAIITGFEFSIKGFQDKGGSTNYCFDDSVYLTLNGNRIGSNMAIGSDMMLSPDTIVTYGGKYSLWGTNLTPSDINSDGVFGVDIGFSGVSSIINLNDSYFVMKVYYAIPTSDNADLGIRFGVIQPTIVRELKYYNQNIAQAIIDLSEMEYGFDFEIDDNKVFNVYVQQGSDKTDSIRLEYGVNVESAEIVEDMTNPGNRAIVLGQSFSGTDLLRVEKNDIPSQASTKLREYLVNQNDVSDEESLDYLGNAVLRKYKQPVLSIQVNLTKNANITAKDIGLGDVVKTSIHSGIYEIDVDMRINEYSVGVGNDGSEQLSILVSIL